MTQFRVVAVERVDELPVDVGPDTLVVSADPDVLAEAGRRGAQRLVVDDPDAAAAALDEFVALLTHRSSRDGEPG